MSKWITEQFAENRSFVEILISVAAEAKRSFPSRAFEDFQEEDPSIICKVLNWKDEKRTHKLIEANVKGEDYVSLAGLIVQNLKHGFIAKVHVPVASDISKDDHGFRSWTSSDGYCHVKWLYADSMAELAAKMEDLDSEELEYDYQKQEEKEVGDE